MTTSIFGQGNCIIRYSSTNYEVPYSKIITPNWQDDRVLEDESIVNGYRRMVWLWTHCDFLIRSFLCNYSSLSDRITAYNTLQGLNHKDVYFYPYKDGDVAADADGKIIKDSANADVPFFVMSVVPGSLDDFNTLDVVDIYLKSKVPFDITKSVITVDG
jgi:hypothetical protein